VAEGVLRAVQLSDTAKPLKSRRFAHLFLTGQIKDENLKKRYECIVANVIEGTVLTEESWVQEVRPTIEALLIELGVDLSGDKVSKFLNWTLEQEGVGEEVKCFMATPQPFFAALIFAQRFF
jgi:hypothetical protein